MEGKYVCPSRRKESNKESKVEFNSVTEFPCLFTTPKNKPSPSSFCDNASAKEAASKHDQINVKEGETLNFAAAIQLSAEKIAQRRATQQQAQKMHKQNAKKNLTKLKMSKVTFTPRTYDNDGWMTNDDWLFWFEHYHPTQKGMF